MTELVLLVEFGDDGVRMAATSATRDTDSVSVVVAVPANVVQWQRYTPPSPPLSSTVAASAGSSSGLPVVAVVVTQAAAL